MRKENFFHYTPEQQLTLWSYDHPALTLPQWQALRDATFDPMKQQAEKTHLLATLRTHMTEQQAIMHDPMTYFRDVAHALASPWAAGWMEDRTQPMHPDTEIDAITLEIWAHCDALAGHVVDALAEQLSGLSTVSLMALTPFILCEKLEDENRKVQLDLWNKLTPADTLSYSTTLHIRDSIHIWILRMCAEPTATPFATRLHGVELWKRIADRLRTPRYSTERYISKIINDTLFVVLQKEYWGKYTQSKPIAAYLTHFDQCGKQLRQESLTLPLQTNWVNTQYRIILTEIDTACRHNPPMIPETGSYNWGKHFNKIRQQATVTQTPELTQALETIHQKQMHLFQHGLNNPTVSQPLSTLLKQTIFLLGTTLEPTHMKPETSEHICTQLNQPIGGTETEHEEARRQATFLNANTLLNTIELQGEVYRNRSKIQPDDASYSFEGRLLGMHMALTAIIRETGYKRYIRRLQQRLANTPIPAHESLYAALKRLVPPCTTEIAAPQPYLRKLSCYIKEYQRQKIDLSHTLYLPEFPFYPNLQHLILSTETATCIQDIVASALVRATFPPHMPQSVIDILQQLKERGSALCQLLRNARHTHTVREKPALTQHLALIPPHPDAMERLLDISLVYRLQLIYAEKPLSHDYQAMLNKQFLNAVLQYKKPHWWQRHEPTTVSLTPPLMTLYQAQANLAHRWHEVRNKQSAFDDVVTTRDEQLAALLQVCRLLDTNPLFCIVKLHYDTFPDAPFQNTFLRQLRIQKNFLENPHLASTVPLYEQTPASATESTDMRWGQFVAQQNTMIKGLWSLHTSTQAPYAPREPDMWLAYDTWLSHYSTLLHSLSANTVRDSIRTYFACFDAIDTAGAQLEQQGEAREAFNCIRFSEAYKHLQQTRKVHHATLQWLACLYGIQDPRLWSEAPFQFTEISLHGDEGLEEFKATERADEDTRSLASSTDDSLHDTQYTVSSAPYTDAHSTISSDETPHAHTEYTSPHSNDSDTVDPTPTDIVDDPIPLSEDPTYDPARRFRTALLEQLYRELRTYHRHQSEKAVAHRELVAIAHAAINEEKIPSPATSSTPDSMNREISDDEDAVLITPEEALQEMHAMRRSHSLFTPTADEARQSSYVSIDLNEAASDAESGFGEDSLEDWATDPTIRAAEDWHEFFLAIYAKDHEDKLSETEIKRSSRIGLTTRTRYEILHTALSAETIRYNPHKTHPILQFAICVGYQFIVKYPDKPLPSLQAWMSWHTARHQEQTRNVLVEFLFPQASP